MNKEKSFMIAMCILLVIGLVYPKQQEEKETWEYDHDLGWEDRSNDDTHHEQAPTKDDSKTEGQENNISEEDIEDLMYEYGY